MNTAIRVSLIGIAVLLAFILISSKALTKEKIINWFKDLFNFYEVVEDDE